MNEKATNKPNPTKAKRYRGISERVKGKERSPMYQPFDAKKIGAE